MNFVSRRPSAKVESLFPESPLPYIKVAKKPSLSQALFPRLRPRCFTTFIVLALSAYQLAFQTYAYTSYEYFGCALFDFGALYPPTVHTDCIASQRLRLVLPLPSLDIPVQQYLLVPPLHANFPHVRPAAPARLRPQDMVHLSGRRAARPPPLQRHALSQSGRRRISTRLYDVGDPLLELLPTAVSSRAALPDAGPGHRDDGRQLHLPTGGL